METKKRILIVDDSAIIIDRLISMLNGLENIQSIAHAGTFSDAVSLLKKDNPDIAILDITLPDKSGIELLRYIKKELPSITVIMLTNQGDDYYRNLCKSSGADHFLDKSTEFEKVPAIISSLSDQVV